MKHESEIVEFSEHQVLCLIAILEGYEVECPAVGEIFSELLVEALRLLSKEQVEELLEAL